MVQEGTVGAARRVTFVADELLGYAGNGIGTTTTFMSVALARVGHRVEVLFAGRPPDTAVEPEWERLYEDAGVSVRVVPYGTQSVEPAHFARGCDVEAALCADPPDVVVVQDLGAPAYTAIRLRALGLAFERTSFVVFCHGTRQWITDISGKVRVLPGALAVSLLERASVELADAVVSPSTYLVDWMRGQGWQLPEQTFVIPHLSRAGATGEPPPSPVEPDGVGVERLAFFGRLEERKGMRPFAEALNALEPELLRRVDVEFLGRPTPAWPTERVAELLDDSTRAALRGLTFETGLDQHEAIARLRRPGTLAVIPSYAENSPNTIYECLENGIPFLASTAAGIRELVASDDHDRVLTEPTPAALATALRRALTNGDALRPARRAYNDADSLHRWSQVVALPARAFPQHEGDARIGAGWVLAVAEPDTPEPEFAEVLVRAQRVSGADVVTCGLLVNETVHLFPGEPRALGLLANGYGTAALIRRPLVEGRESEPTWPLLASLAASGASIVSVPRPLVRSPSAPATLESDPRQALRVVAHLEAALPDSVRLTAELATRLRLPASVELCASSGAAVDRSAATVTRRVTVVASEALGLPGAGGPGTADSLLALALARHGHSVELLLPPGRDFERLSTEWVARYADASVRLRPLAETVAVQPSFLAPAWHVHEALRDDPPDVVVADDWRALAWAALQSRRVGRSCLDTAFVLYCHGPARVFAEAARKVPDTLARFGEEVAQRACLELADVVVSPSDWLLRWLGRHDWPVPESARVIPNLWETTALGRSVTPAPTGAPISRLAFFGQVREGKGVRIFLDGLRLLDPELLSGVEVLFLGHSRSWSEEELSEQAGRQVRLELTLDRAAALEELKQPGTLAVMPSLLENSPYAVAECLEHGIPFVASRVGGTPELVVAEDRERVLCEPTSDDLAEALRRALTSGAAPARPARAPEDSLAHWLEVIETVTPPPSPTTAEVDRREWTVFGDGEDLLETLLAAQSASGADVVTTGVRDGDVVRLFLGDPGAFGLIENQYGFVGLVRRSAATTDSPWVQCARLAAKGARIVSIPEALAPRQRVDAPGDRLAVLQAFEDGDGAVLRQLPQLAATLAAARSRRAPASTDPSKRGRLRRLLG
jgi:glycosyltransferase involved in cell wall biosynthesis